ncbi:MAG: hypothetical protein C4308_07045 [Chitinophagaceae bacterium]
MLIQSVKAPVLITIFSLLSFLSFSQLTLPLGNSLQPIIEKVVKDYPNHFQNIRAEEIYADVQTTDFRSVVVIPGAEECVVTKYAAKNKAVYSWRANMLTTDDFNTAKKKFKTFYSQLNNLSVNLDGHAVIFRSNYQNPTEDKAFCSIIFSDDDYKELKIELAMQYELVEWKIKILVYGKERADNQRGDITEGVNN